jgi:hypothetical protein
MCSKGKFCEEYMALLRTETSGGAGLTRNFMSFLKSPDSVVIRIARLRWAGHVARMDENCILRRLRCVQQEGLRKVPDEEMKWERTKDAGIKELVGNSHESRGVEETSEGSQDSTSCSADDDDDDDGWNSVQFIKYAYL